MTATLTKPAPAKPVSVDPRWWDCPEIDTEQHIRATLGRPIDSLPSWLEDLLENDWATQHSGALCDHFAELTGVEYSSAWRDNSFNSENDLGSEMVIEVFAPDHASDWLWADCFVSIEMHLGGDVRGNYGPARIFRCDDLGDSGFLDWTCGWTVRPVPSAEHDGRAVAWDRDVERINDELSPGWSSHPTSHLRNLLVPKSEPAWSERHGAHVGCFAGIPFPLLMEPFTIPTL